MTGPESLGIIGVGNLAQFIVRGLRHAGDRRDIVLSPRGAAMARQLADAHGCRIAPDNQAVVDAAPLVLVATPPKDALATIAGLRWQAGQVLVCCAIDVDLPGLRRAAPAATIVRTMPTAASAAGAGSTPLVPAEPRAIALFQTVGDVFPCDDERAFATATALSVYHLWLFGLMETMAAGAVEAGLPRAQATGMVASLTRAAGTLAALADPDGSMRLPLDRNGVPGSMTRQGLDALDAADAFRAWRDALRIALARAGGAG